MLGWLAMESPSYHELLRAQVDWNRTYAALAASPSSASTTALRRRLLRLSVQVFWHPFFPLFKSVS
ncbi:putative hypothetical protein [Streptomyces sp. NBRC 110611]|nr:putative hypothetical protein [Streptomyces sp. NBRC 110611]